MFLDPDELIPKRGKDKIYDEIMERAGSLEKSLDEELKELEEELGCVYCIILDLVTYLRDSLKLQLDLLA